MVCPGAIERYLSCGDTMAAWKSIECIIGAATTCTPGTGSSLRLVMVKRIRSPTRARGGTGHLVAEGPGAELHPGRDLDDLVRGVELHFLDGRRIERLELVAHAERLAGGERALVPFVRQGRRH